MYQENSATMYRDGILHREDYNTDTTSVIFDPLSDTVDESHHLKIIETGLCKRSILGISIATGTTKEFLNAFIKISTCKNSAYVCFVNVHMLVEAQKDTIFAENLNNADVSCPDGRPVSESFKWFYGIRQNRIAGPDMLPLLLKLADQFGKRVFILGSKENVLEAFVRNANAEFPNVTICGTYSPPFRQLSSDEDNAIVEKINQSKADMVFVALGCPKQEKWMAEHKGRVHGAMYGIGYAIPVYAGIEHRAPLWMQALCLEWFYRLLCNPGRLWKRYVVTNSIFIYKMLKAKAIGM